MVDGKIYAIGGVSFGVPFSTVEEYKTGFASEEEKVVGIEAKEKLVTSWGKIKSRY